MASNQLRSRTRRWLPVATEVMPPKWTPADTAVLDVPAANDKTPTPTPTPALAPSISVGLDAATLRAIDERTWPRSSNRVLGLDPSTAKATAERTLPTGPIPAALPQQTSSAGPRYELGALLGRGGMGEVFAAYDAQIGRQVAIKRLHADKLTPSSLARFLVEARIQGWLDHPAIPSVYELGSDDQGRPFFVMKRLSGVSLDEILADRDASQSHQLPQQFSEQQLLRAFVEICLTVEFAHTRGVVHRDLKPANMLLGEFGEVYVLDWGVAQVAERGAPSSDTVRHTIEQVAHTAGVLGTPGYMAPEQVSGDVLDGRADVYALGCVLFEILVGRRLHPSGFAGMTSALAGLPVAPSTYREDLAPELDELCRRAVAADRTQRIPSARALAEGIQRYLDGDRDLALRRQLARTHFQAAYRATKPSLDGPIDPVAAMREAGRALALDPTLPGAAELVGHLMLQPSGHMPTVVAAELESADIVEEQRVARIAVGVYTGFALLAPLLFVFGIRDVPYLAALFAFGAINVGLAWFGTSHPRVVPSLVTALALAALFAVIARMFTPLFIAPGVTAVMLMAYAQHPATSRRRELLMASSLSVIAVLGVLIAELCGVIGTTMFVDDGVVRLAPPLAGIDRFPIVPALCFYLVLLVGVGVHFSYSMARRGRDARQKLHLQAWQLRQLVSLDTQR